MEKLKIAIVGTGHVAVKSYLPYLSQRADVELLYYNRTRIPLANLSMLISIPSFGIPRRR